MPILDAALAFALTMLVIATVVTYVVRAVQRITRLRNKQLREMLRAFLEEEVQPVVERELARLQKKAGSQVTSELSGQGDQMRGLTLFGSGDLGKREDIPTEELTEQLKRSEPGRTLLAALGDDALPIFDELGRRYEAVGNRFTESFRKRSRWWATGVAVVLALGLNIDSIHIANSYIRSQTLRENTIAQMDAIMADYETKAAAVSDAEDPATREALGDAIKNSREQIDNLTTVGFPLGWSYFPHSGLEVEKSADFESRNDLGGWIMWGCGIVLTGLLAGLGAPFWYDTVAGISRFAQRARVAKKPETQT